VDNGESKVSTRHDRHAFSRRGQTDRCLNRFENVVDDGHLRRGLARYHRDFARNRRSNNVRAGTYRDGMIAKQILRRIDDADYTGAVTG